jgi:hypothetical protein
MVLWEGRCREPSLFPDQLEYFISRAIRKILLLSGQRMSNSILGSMLAIGENPHRRCRAGSPTHGQLDRQKFESHGLRKQPHF